jgi:hypothetical protein
MGRLLLERPAVGFFGRVIDVLEKTSLTFAICALWISGYILRRMWMSFKIYSRIHGLYLDLLDRCYGGDRLDSCMRDICNKEKARHDRVQEGRG